MNKSTDDKEQTAMLLVKPEWVIHKDEKNKKASVFSIHAHPDGTRIATGGLDSRVKIWNTAPILSEREEENPKCDKLLCTLALHNGVVLCVRFSPSGRFLASGSDDQIIMIWERDESSSGFGRVFGSSDINVENWKGTRRLAGHESDVCDLAWSNDSSYLASCGLDSLVIIWDGNTFDRIVKIEKHVAFVKGVTWDPVGKYLATESDDGSVKIWRTEDWELEAHITKPFLNAPKNSFFRRLSWSPDGLSLTAANAMNGPVVVATVISRDLWDSDTSLVGHDRAIEAAAYNPHLYRPKGAVGSENITAIVAIGSQDGGISVWSALRGTPLFVAQDIFEGSVFDLCWSPDGLTLYACSNDGTIAAMQFQAEELGNRLQEHVKNAMLAKFGYTKPLRPYIPPTQPAQAFGTTAQPNVLQTRRLTDIMDGAPLKPQTNGIEHPPGPAVQKVTKLANGKRRIQPSFVSSLSASTESPAPAAAPVSIPPPRIPESAPTANPFQPNSVMPQPSNGFPIPSNIFSQPAVNAFQPPSLPPNQTSTINTSLGSAFNGTMTAPSSSAESPISAARPWVSAPSEDLRRSPEKRKDPPEEDVDAPNKRRKPLLKAMAPIPLKEIRPASVPSFNEETNGAPEVKPVIWLPVPSIKTTVSVEVHNGVTIECRNSEERKPSSVEIKVKDGQLFFDFLQNPVVAVAGTAHFFAVACEDASIILYTPAGRRFMPNLLLEAPASFMEATEYSLMIITALGNLYVWDLKRCRAMFAPTSISPLLGNYAGRGQNLEIRSADIRGNGVPMVCLSNGSAHIYEADMMCWQCISETWWAVGSDAWDMSRRGHGARGIVKQIESKVNEVYVELGRDKIEKEVLKCSIGGTDWEVAVSIGHLETRMATAITLNSAAEYKQYLLAYARKLSDESVRGKAEELCKDFLGPIYYRAGDPSSKWTPTVVGLQKRDLLKDFLPIFARNRMLQRIASDYQDLLKKVNSDNDEWD